VFKFDGGAPALPTNTNHKTVRFRYDGTNRREISQSIEVGESVVNLRQFGARGVSATEHTTALNNAVAACPAANRRAKAKLVIPYGDYLINQKVRIAADGLVVEGIGGTSEGSNGSTFHWTGNASDPMFELHARDCEFRNFGIKPDAALYARIRLANFTDVSYGFVPSKSGFAGIVFTTPVNGAGPYFPYCVEFTGALAGTADNNNDYHDFDKCSFTKRLRH
jgi:hypothetical protein